MRCSMWSLLFAMGCATPEGSETPSSNVPTSSEARPIVVSASHPVSHLVDRLAGEMVDHRRVLPPGVAAQDWAPGAAVVIDLQGADRIVLNGAGLEGWVKTVSLSSDKQVDLSSSIDRIEEEGQVHSHGRGGEHSHRSIDPRVWTDPLAYRAQAQALHATLVRLEGVDAPILDANLSALTNDLNALHEELQVATSDLKGLRLIAAQPSFAYLAKRYGLDVTALDVDAQDATQDLSAFEQATRHQAFSIVLWGEAPSDDVVSLFSSTTRHVVLDPLSDPTASGFDYMVQGRLNAVALDKVVPDVDTDGR